MHLTTTRKLLSAARVFRDNPHAHITTGMWYHPTWNNVEFRRWFVGCLIAKINSHDPRWIENRRYANPKYQIDLRLDRFMIEQRRFRELRTEHAQKTYPISEEVE